MKTTVFLLFLLLLPFSVSFAAPIVDSGTILQQQGGQSPALQQLQKTEPLLQPADSTAVKDLGPEFEVQGFRFTGNQAVVTSELEQLVLPWVGRKMSLADLQQPIAEITRYYREQGFLLARALLPVQKVVGGIVEIRVVEPSYSKVTINDHGSLQSSAKGPLRNIRQGDNVTSDALERNLLLMKDLPGIDVKSTLTPGADPETTELLIDIQPGKAYSASLRTDNYGGHTNGRYRVGADLQLYNPASLGDRLAFNVVEALSGGETTNGSLNYQLPVGENGWNLAAGLSYMQYSLGKEFKSLDAVGDATVFNLDAIYPLIRSQKTNLNINLRYVYKRLVDEYESIRYVKKRENHAGSLQLSGDRKDNFWGGGANSFSLQVKAGDLSLDNQSERVDAISAKTSGEFYLADLMLARTQAIDDKWSLRGSVSLQRSDKNLDSSERMSLCGIAGVRAYPGSELSVDDGELLRVDLNRLISSKLQVGVFYDLAHGQIDHNQYRVGSNTRTLKGTGIGLSAMPLENLYLDASVATQIGNEKITSEPHHDELFWLQMVYYF